MSNTPTLNRKEKLGTSVRGALNEQLSKIQIKHNAELELIEDIRNFLKQRAQIEREYSQNIQKLVSQYQCKRDPKTPPELSNFHRLENRGIMEVWKTLLDKTEELGKRRITVADLLSGSIVEDLKVLKREKEQVFKRQVEIMQLMISEVLDSVRELTTAKKLYNEKWKMCEDARQKFQDVDNRLHQSNLKMFETKATLEKAHKKASEKLKSAQKQLVVQRNEYLLTLSECNTHLVKHFETDLPEALKIIDGELYDKVRNLYVLYSQIEIDTTSVMRAEFEDLREKANLVNREYVLECFMTINPILRDKINYQFESAGNDKVTAISKDHQADLYLNKEARNQCQKLTKLHQQIKEKNKLIKGLQSVTQAYHVNPEFGTTDALAEAKQNLSQIQEDIRQIEVITTKTNARLDTLKESGIDVNKWLQQAAHIEGEYTPGERKSSQDKTLQPDLVDLNASLRPHLLSTSSLSLKTTDSDTASLVSDAISISSFHSEVNNTNPTYCKVLYCYQAQRPDELDILTDDELDIIEWDDGDGWCKGRNTKGQEGYFPQSYVQPISRPSSPPDNNNKPNNSTDKCQVMLRALFEYTAQEEEELSFPGGAIIRLLRTDDNGIDDGWWEGSYEGKVGVFPSIVVEKIKDVTAEELTPVSSEIFPFFPTSPIPPPPSYPAPDISANDLFIPPLRQLQQSLSSSSTPSLTDNSLSVGAPHIKFSSPAVKRSSAVISQQRPVLSKLCDSFQDSFEDTLQNTSTQKIWNSFEDDDDSYV